LKEATRFYDAINSVFLNSLQQWYLRNTSPSSDVFGGLIAR